MLEKERAVEHAQSHLQEMEAQYQTKCAELEAAQFTHKEVYEQLQTVVDNLQLEYSNVWFFAFFDTDVDKRF